MFSKKSLLKYGCLITIALVSACSSDKEIPEGKRISVLSPISSIQPDASKNNIKVPVATANQSWLQSGYNAQHLLPNSAVETSFVKAWSVDFGEGNSKREFLVSTPLTDGKYVYTFDAEAVLSAFDINTGSRVWRYKIKDDNKNTSDSSLKGIGIAAQNNVIYALTGYGDVYAIDAEKGEKLWKQSYNRPFRIAPSVVKDKLFIQSADNKFLALDLKDGSKLWDFDISLENTTIVGGAPAAYSNALDVVVTGFSNGEIQAFNASLGTPLWSDVLISNRQAYSSTFLNTIKAASVIEGDVVYAVGNANVLTALDVRSGMRLWQKEIGSMNTPLVAGNTLYVVSNSNELVAIDKENGDVIWTSAIDLGKKRSEVSAYAPVMINSKVLVTLSNGIVYTYNPKDGKLLNTTDLDEKINSEPISAAGYVFVVTSDADLIAYK